MLKYIYKRFIARRKYISFDLFASGLFCRYKSKAGKINDGLRIYICGPHSTGKTTLVHDLKHHLKDVKIVEEEARREIELRGWSHDDYDPVKHPDVFKHIAVDILSQQIDIDKSCEQSGQIFIVDRSFLDSIVYIGYYLGEMDKQSAYKLPGVDECIKRLKRSLVVLVYPQANCISQDNIRLDSNLKELIHLYDAFEKEYQDNAIPFIKLTEPNRQERVIRVMREIISVLRRENATNEIEQVDRG